MQLVFCFLLFSKACFQSLRTLVSLEPIPDSKTTLSLFAKSFDHPLSGKCSLLTSEGYPRKLYACIQERRKVGLGSHPLARPHFSPSHSMDQQGRLPWPTSYATENKKRILWWQQKPTSVGMCAEKRTGGFVQVDHFLYYSCDVLAVVAILLGGWGSKLSSFDFAW